MKTESVHDDNDSRPDSSIPTTSFVSHLLSPFYPVIHFEVLS